MISEYANLAERETLSLEWRLARTSEICNGMKYLAEHKIVHRDLAARNILLDSNTVAKISDFGMAKDVYLQRYYKQRREGCFPLRWMAIESIEKLAFSEKSDVWSFGVLVWEIFTDGKQLNKLFDRFYSHYTMIESFSVKKKRYSLAKYTFICSQANSHIQVFFP